MKIIVSDIWSSLTFSWIGSYLKDIEKNTVYYKFKSDTYEESQVDKKIQPFLKRILINYSYSSFYDTLNIYNINQKKKTNVLGHNYDSSSSNFVKELLRKYYKDLAKCVILNIIKILLSMYLNLKFKYFLYDSYSKWIFFSGINLVIIKILKIVFDIFNNYYFSLFSLKIQLNLLSTIFKVTLDEAIVFNNETHNQKCKEIKRPNIHNLAFGDLNFIESFLTALIEILTYPFRIFGVWFLLNNQIGLLANYAVVTYLTITIISFSLQAFGSLKKKVFMEFRDERINKCYYYFSSLEVIRQHFWEKIIYDDIMAIREKEVRANFIRHIFSLLGTFLEYNASTFSQYILFCTFVYYYNFGLENNHKTIFSSGFATLHALNILTSQSKNIVPSIIEGYVSIIRIKNFFKNNINKNLNYDYDILNHESVEDNEGLLIIQNAIFMWSNYEDKQIKKNKINKKGNYCNSESDFLIDINVESKIKNFRLHIQNLSLKRGECCIVTGMHFSGKTSFIKSLLGKMETVFGKSVFRTKKKGIKFCCLFQNKWIPKGTVRSSILFGQEYNKKIYDNVIKACVLDIDLNKWNNGDLRIVDENDQTLSNGQKSRICLARTLYYYEIIKRTEYDSFEIISLLDDIFSGLDVYISKKIFNNLFGTNGILCDSLSILSCNPDSITLLFSEEDFKQKKLHKILFLEKGNILFYGIIEKYISLINKLCLDKEKSLSKNFNAFNEIIKLENKNENDLKITNYADEIIYQSSSSYENSISEKKKKYSFHVYLFYFKKIGIIFTIVFAIACFIKIWIAELVILNINGFLSSFRNEELSTESFTKKKFILYFTVLIIIKIFVECFTFILEVLITIKASKVIHKEYLMSLLNAPSSFYSLTPISKILNRFNLDIFFLDDIIVKKMAGILIRLFESFLKLSLTLFSCPIIGIFIDIHLILIIYIFGTPILKIFRVTQSIVLKQSVLISNIISEVKDGKEFICSFENSNNLYVRKFRYFLCNIVNLRVIQISAIQWSSFRIQIFSGPIVIFFYSVLIFLSENSQIISISNNTKYSAGLIIYYLLTFTETLNIIFLRLSYLEKDMCSIERIKEYSDLFKNSNLENQNNYNENNYFFNNSQDVNNILDKGIEQEIKPEIQSPNLNNTHSIESSEEFKCGPLVFENVYISFLNNNISENKLKNKFSYTPISNFCFSMKPKEHIGILGKTGCGKSSLIKAVLGTVKPSSGRILFNGIEISNIPLNKRRKIIGVVTQTNCIFSSWSLKKYMDPYNKYTDDQIKEALGVTKINKILTNLDKNADLNSIKISSIASKSNFKDIIFSYLSFSRLILNRNSYRLVLLDEPYYISNDYKLLSTYKLNSFAQTKVELQELVPIEDLLKTYFKDCSVIIVSHNPFILKYCHRIIKLTD
ncbi:hypothetical protein FG386_003695 [Cryptosporidium ryanae]|uniref:uncharacterized protein n=1 Tax=Cryptosporidium ryanae TaxID=515981 RepID=UPI00351A18E5|nr:hypothetical protein FG386_003695 [Cryptosporidium ryanae]